MQYDWLDEYLLSKKGVQKDYKAEWNWDRYMIDGKLFLAVCYNEQNAPYFITLKLDPFEGEFLRANYEDIIPGYYMNKVHWNSIKADGAVPAQLVRELADKAYELVKSSLPKKRRDTLFGE